MWTGDLRFLLPCGTAAVPDRGCRVLLEESCYVNIRVACSRQIGRWQTIC